MSLLSSTLLIKMSFFFFSIFFCVHSFDFIHKGLQKGSGGPPTHTPTHTCPPPCIIIIIVVVVFIITRKRWTQQAAAGRQEEDNAGESSLLQLCREETKGHADRQRARADMALIPSQVLRAAILLSYFSILCHYKALDMPAHQTYGGSWKFLTFIDLVRERFCSVLPPTPPEIAASRDLQARRFVSQSSGTESCKGPKEARVPRSTLKLVWCMLVLIIQRM